MSGLLRFASLRWLQVVLGLALMALVLAPGASGAAQLDTVTATGSGLFTPEPPMFPPGAGPSNINISARSGTSGQNPTGTASFTVGALSFSGPVTCLSVTGPDRGAGTSGSPTTAVLNFRDTTFGIVSAVKLVDKDGNGADIMTIPGLVRAPTDCSPFSDRNLIATLTNGRAVVFDAPLLPISKEQCKNGGWRNFPQFKNQGQCVRFVETGK